MVVIEHSTLQSWSQRRPDMVAEFPFLAPLKNLKCSKCGGVSTDSRPIFDAAMEALQVLSGPAKAKLKQLAGAQRMRFRLKRDPPGKWRTF